MAILKNTIINDTGFLQLPRGSTNQRPSNPNEGDMRYNTTINKVEWYDGTGWFNATLYDFSTFVFTNANQTGRLGPTRAACLEAYAPAPWVTNTNFFDVPRRGIQEWTVPEDAVYEITAAGAEGGHATSTNSVSVNRRGGRGTIMRGRFFLEQGEVVCIIVGQQGQGRQNVNSPSFNERAGGGGGTFVWKKSVESNPSTATPLIVAGGGGGASGDPSTGRVGTDAVVGESGTQSGRGSGTGGTDGNGGTSSGGSFRAGAGGGFRTDGSGGGDGKDGQGALNGGVGGTCNPSSGLNFDGGFGGGGADARLNSTSADSEGTGGGGGYSGGAGGNASLDDDGGGGGSFNSGTNQESFSGNNGNSGHGFVTVLKIGSPSIPPVTLPPTTTTLPPGQLSFTGDGDFEEITVSNTPTVARNAINSGTVHVTINIFGPGGIIRRSINDSPFAEVSNLEEFSINNGQNLRFSAQPTSISEGFFAFVTLKRTNASGDVIGGFTVSIGTGF